MPQQQAMRAFRTPCAAQKGHARFAGNHACFERAMRASAASATSLARPDGVSASLVICHLTFLRRVVSRRSAAAPAGERLRTRLQQLHCHTVVVRLVVRLCTSRVCAQCLQGPSPKYLTCHALTGVGLDGCSWSTGRCLQVGSPSRPAAASLTSGTACCCKAQPARGSTLTQEG